MKRGKNGFQKKLRKIFDLKIFRSESFSIRTSRIESSRFRTRVAKGRPAFRDRITRGSLESGYYCALDRVLLCRLIGTNQ